MNANELKRNENLCNKLDMNFDEANELFGNETLSNMQMVRVNGGLIVITCAIIVAAAILLCSCNSTGDPSGGSSGETTDDIGDVEVKDNGDGSHTAVEIKTNNQITSDTINVYNPDGSLQRTFGSPVIIVPSQ